MVFGALSCTWALWFSLSSWKKRAFRNAALCVLFTSVYGAIDEVHQSFTPGRFAGADDWLADTLGAILGATVCVLLTRFLTKNIKEQQNDEK